MQNNTDHPKARASEVVDSGKRGYENCPDCGKPVERGPMGWLFNADDSFHVDDEN